MSDERERPADTAKRVGTEQAIKIAALAASVLIVSMQRQLTEADFWRGLRMRAAKTSERAHARLAAWAWHRAESSRKAYESERGAS